MKRNKYYSSLWEDGGLTEEDHTEMVSTVEHPMGNQHVASLLILAELKQMNKQLRDMNAKLDARA